MKKIIWKFALKLEPNQFVTMPDGAEILSVHEQRGAICLWALVNPNNPCKNRLITIMPTGDAGGEYQGAEVTKGEFIGTVVSQNNFVWHFFDRDEDKNKNSVAS